MLILTVVGSGPTDAIVSGFRMSVLCRFTWSVGPTSHIVDDGVARKIAWRQKGQQTKREEEKKFWPVKIALWHVKSVNWKLLGRNCEIRCYVERQTKPFAVAPGPVNDIWGENEPWWEIWLVERRSQSSYPSHWTRPTRHLHEKFGRMTSQKSFGTIKYDDLTEKYCCSSKLC